MLSEVSATSPAVGTFSRQYRSLTIGMVVLAVLGAFEALAVTTAMPTINTELDGLRLYALAFAAPLATGVVAMVLTGNWSDRSGPRVPLLTTVALFATGLLIAGLADSMGVLVLGRGHVRLGGGPPAVAAPLLRQRRAGFQLSSGGVLAFVAPFALSLARRPSRCSALVEWTRRSAELPALIRRPRSGPSTLLGRPGAGCPERPR